MAKFRGRKIASVSITNPRRIMKKVARARAYASLHCRDVTNVNTLCMCPSADVVFQLSRGQMQSFSMYII